MIASCRPGCRCCIHPGDPDRFINGVVDRDILKDGVAGSGAKMDRVCRCSPAGDIGLSKPAGEREGGFSQGSDHGPDRPEHDGGLKCHVLVDLIRESVDPDRQTCQDGQ
jgi:hypothetical protein